MSGGFFRSPKIDIFLYEHGFRLTCPKKQIDGTFRFTDIDTFLYDNVPNDVGIYTQLDLHMTAGGKESFLIIKPWKISSLEAAELDPTLHALASALALDIAERLALKLRNGSVEWVPGLLLSSDGFQFEGKQVRYSEVTEEAIDGNTLRISTTGAVPQVWIPTNVANYQPGLIVFRNYVDSRR